VKRLEEDEEGDGQELTVPLIEVRDVQVYHYEDFEFIQKLHEPKRSFILRKYNK